MPYMQLVRRVVYRRRDVKCFLALFTHVSNPPIYDMQIFTIYNSIPHIAEKRYNFYRRQAIKLARKSETLPRPWRGGLLPFLLLAQKKR